jgi:hypothetical protein
LAARSLPSLEVTQGTEKAWASVSEKIFVTSGSPGEGALGDGIFMAPLDVNRPAPAGRGLFTVKESYNLSALTLQPFNHSTPQSTFRVSDHKILRSTSVNGQKIL